MRPNPLGRIAIVGAGQAGTMLGMALVAGRRASGVDTVTLFDIDADIARASLARGAGDAIGAGPADAFAAGTVVLAVPIPAIVSLLDDLGPTARPGALVIDTGSAKRIVVDAMRRSVPAHAHAVGGHPMAGTERAGPRAADPDLLRGATFVLTPAREDPDGMAKARAFVEAVGGHPVEMEAGAHDQAVALASHLPHLLAFALADAAQGVTDDAARAAIAALVSTGFLGVTRLAEGDPAMIAGFLSANSDQVEAAAARFGSAFDALVGTLRDRDALARKLAVGRAARSALQGREQP